ncbi:acyltransferase family protein [Mucilaginibacter sp. Mucisp86]|uniref:acyltransferase family protein n=1 Tax=Mucilaginibacter sp. Mucisp86 TaxID=3243060 RepID=UPI0039B53706
MKKVINTTQYYQNLDLLRFFLSVSVVIYHIPRIAVTVLHVNIFDKLPIFHKGAEAVYFFFTLSGFLITRLLLKEKLALNDIDLKKFYMRRVLRIWPVYFLVLLIGLTYYNVILPKMGIHGKDNYSIGTALVLCLLFLSNVFQRIYSPGSALAILWSIGVEEQFYLFWPVLFKKVKARFVLGILIVLYLVIFIYNFLTPSSLLIKYRFLFDFMIMGGISAILVDKYQQLAISLFTSLWCRILFFILFILVFFTDVFNVVQGYNQQVYDSICAIIASLLIITLTYLPAVNRLNFLTYLGKVSYGIYMYHMLIVNFVLFVALKLNFTSTFSVSELFFVLNFSVLVITFLFAHFSYKYFETYFLKLKDKFTKIKAQ